MQLNPVVEHEEPVARTLYITQKLCKILPEFGKHWHRRKTFASKLFLNFLRQLCETSVDS